MTINPPAGKTSAPSVVIEYRDSWRVAQLEIPSPPFLDPSGLQVVAADPGRVTYGPRIANDAAGPDVIAGFVPLPHLVDGRIRVASLEIPPPKPLSTDALTVMWNDISQLPVPVPRSVPVQARLPPGTSRPAEQLVPEMLDRAHSAARLLATRWPASLEETIEWRGLELPGGREDVRQTLRFGGRMPAQTTRSGIRRPARTARRLLRARPWQSLGLYTLAARLAERTRGLVDAAEGTDAKPMAAVLAPFQAVARQARPTRALVDPPFSNWPEDAVTCYAAMYAALGVIEATKEGLGTRTAPLCHVWRLYEAWVAAQLLCILGQSGRVNNQGGPTSIDGAEWVARWDLIPGGQLFLFAQPHISRDPQTFDGLLPIGVRSITSDLRPDALIFVVTAAGSVGMAAVDAKLRSPGQIDARDVAEAASKYAWGLRLSEPSAGSSAAEVSATLIAACAKVPTMHHDGSRILAMRLVPGEDHNEANRLVDGLIIRAESEAVAR